MDTGTCVGWFKLRGGTCRRLYEGLVASDTRSSRILSTCFHHVVDKRGYGSFYFRVPSASQLTIERNPHDNSPTTRLKSMWPGNSRLPVRPGSGFDTQNTSGTSDCLAGGMAHWLPFSTSSAAIMMTVIAYL